MGDFILILPQINSIASWVRYFIAALSKPQGPFGLVATSLGQGLGGITPVWVIVTAKKPRNLNWMILCFTI
jgi:hypothetical protein